jgi:EAL domain-containing protein (putative c-di-GMP-specific phosphodiesterase class I)
MYRAKTLGKARYELFDLALQSPTVGHLQLNTDLRYAVERQGLQLHYQPIVSLQSGQITGMEALVRWPHPERGFISPAEFIPLAEETGLIVPIGEWVLQTACRQNKIWQDMGYNQLRVAVNISARQIQGRNLLELVQEVLADTELAPENLEIEITESLEMMRNLDLNTSTLNSLSDLGVKISIDDFGNRYSSLVYLKLFPINNIKIDKSFVDDMAYVADSAAITAGIITMAHNLRLKVIAEGVETQEQLSCLRTQQCDEIQGYLFSQPVSASDATQLLRQSASLQSNVKSRKQMCP